MSVAAKFENSLVAWSREAMWGVLVTTSNFMTAALEDANGAGSNIVLIDSDILVDLLLSVNVGIHLVAERADIDEEAFRKLQESSWKKKVH